MKSDVVTLTLNQRILAKDTALVSKPFHGSAASHTSQLAKLNNIGRGSIDDVSRSKTSYPFFKFFHFLWSVSILLLIPWWVIRGTPDISHDPSSLNAAKTHVSRVPMLSGCEQPPGSSQPASLVPDLIGHDTISLLACELLLNYYLFHFHKM